MRLKVRCQVCDADLTIEVVADVVRVRPCPKEHAVKVKVEGSELIMDFGGEVCSEKKST